MLLNGLQVLEVGSGLSIAWAGATLRDFGASVSRLLATETPNESTFTATLNRGKAVVDGCSPAAALSGRNRPDVVILDRVAVVPPGVPTALDEYTKYVSHINNSAWVTISGYGLSGPMAPRFGSDFTIAAAAGVVGYARDADDNPRALPAHQALLAAGQAAVLAALYGVDRWHTEGTPVHVEVSAQEAMLATGVMLQCTETTLNYRVTGGTHRFGAPAGWYECADGRVFIALHEDHQWKGIKRAMRAPEPIASWQTANDRIEHSEEIDSFVVEWARQRGKAEVEARMQDEGVPVTTLNSLDELRHSARFAQRARWRDDTINGEKLTTMGTPHLIADSGGVAKQARGLRELKVVEASHILAASIAGSVLGAMGARVIKIEELGRLDQYRRSGPFMDGNQDQEWSGYFSSANHSKRSFSFSETSAVYDLVEGADAVIENWGASRARRMGIDSDSVSKSWPDKLGASCSGFGHAGPLAKYRAYAANLNGYCGLLHSLGDGSGRIGSPGGSWADYTSGYALATVVAAWATGRRDSTGRNIRTGMQIDMSMAEMVVQRLNEVLVEAQRGAKDEQASTDVLLSTNSGSRWVAATPPSRGALLAAVGLGENATDDQLRAATTDRQASELTDQLASAGIVAAAVCTAPELVVDPHLVARGFFSTVNHERWGRRRIVGVPWRTAGGDAIPLSPPPLLGDANGVDPWGSTNYTL